MPLKDFIKRADGDLDEQEENFITKLPVYSATLGIDAAEEANTISVLTAHRSSFTAMVESKATHKAAVALNQTNKTSAVDEFRRIAKKIKASVNYSEEIGNDLGIIGADVPTPDPSSMKPTLKVKLSGQNVIIEFNKQGMEGVRIYSKRGTEGSFTYLATDTHSPYTDSRTKLVDSGPEERQYYAFYFVENSDAGIQSDVISIAVP